MAQPTEFDVAGATYYAVAPTGYSYSAEQDTQYSTRKYNTLAAAEAALSGTFSTPVVINIIGDWTTDGPEIISAVITFDGFTTSSTNYLLIRCIGDARHNGVWDTSAYILENDTTGYTIDIDPADDVKLDGIQLTKTYVDFSSVGILFYNNPNGNPEISNCILKGTMNPSANEMALVVFQCNTFKMWNCLIYRWTRGGTTTSAIEVGPGGLNTGDVYIYSCTFAKIDSKYGIHKVSGTGNIYCKNCYVGMQYGDSTAAYANVSEKITCAARDSGDTGTSGLNNIEQDTNTFVNVTDGSEDYNLAVGSPLIGVGTNTTDDPPPLDFDDDIAGDTR